MDFEQKKISTPRFSNLSPDRTPPYCTQSSVLDLLKNLKLINLDKKMYF